MTQYGQGPYSDEGQQGGPPYSGAGPYGNSTPYGSGPYGGGAPQPGGPPQAGGGGGYWGASAPAGGAYRGPGPGPGGQYGNAQQGPPASAGGRRPSTRRVPRSRGAATGVILMLLGAWGAIVPFVGPYFNFEYLNDKTWYWTTGRLWLEVVPGAAALLAGLLLLFTASRAVSLVAAWLAIAAGIWFVIGPPVNDRYGIGVIGGPLSTSRLPNLLEALAFFFALGALITAFGATAFGRLSVVSVRDLRAAEERARRDEAARREAAVAREREERERRDQAQREQYERQQREQYERDQRAQYERAQRDEQERGASAGATAATAEYPPQDGGEAATTQFPRQEPGETTQFPRQEGAGAPESDRNGNGATAAGDPGRPDSEVSGRGAGLEETQAMPPVGDETASGGAPRYRPHHAPEGSGTTEPPATPGYSPPPESGGR